MARVPASGMTQPNGSVSRPSSVEVTENQNTMAEVRSSCASLRTKIMAMAVQAAPVSVTTAPRLWRGSPVTPAPSRGDKTITTPSRPSATIDRRNRRTGSPRNIAARITVSSGAA